MSLMEIIYAVVIGASGITLLTVIIALIANIFKPKKVNEEYYEEVKPAVQYAHPKFADYSLFNLYRRTLMNYPDLCDYIQLKEQCPLRIENKEIIRSW